MIQIVLIFLVLATPAYALESDAHRSARAVATLVTDTDTVQAGVPLHVALRLRLARGWHTYWRNPGDAGIAPELTLTLPAGSAAGPIAWPTPVRLPEGPVMAYGYTDEVLLPVVVTPGAGELALEASATWLVCERVCVPEEAAFHLVLPPGTPAPSAEAPLFAAAAARTPRESPFEARVGADGTVSLVGTGLSAATVQGAWFFPDVAGVVDHAAPQRLTVVDGAVRIALTPGPDFKPGVALDGVVVLRDGRGDESSLLVHAAPGLATQVEAGVPFWEVLALAMLGGLVLNLMPCVFPILAMKAVAIARLSGEARGAVRAHAASYTAGVLVAFGGLGAALLALRSAGAAAGWGFQFTSPVFVAGMAWVLFAVGLNLSGVYQVGGRLAGAGQGLVRRGGHGGSFFTGLLAVIVATPCTAPFMGAAVAAALAAPPVMALVVFLAMGLGLAAPYALLAVAPGLACGLPRPGAWMDVLRGALAFPMYAAAAWLVWVISLQAGPGGVLVTASGLVLLGFAAWCLGLAQASGRRLGYGAAAVAMVAALAVLPGLAGARGAGMALTEGSEAFSPARLAALRAEGRPVFVNMTAAWCVTCLVNERVALSSDAVRQAFTSHNVAYLKGDWTRGDPVVTAFLREHAREGVPLYVFYPAHGAPAILPQILTEGEVLARVGGG